jgi:hypothetical protein
VSKLLGQSLDQQVFLGSVHLHGDVFSARYFDQAEIVNTASVACINPTRTNNSPLVLEIRLPPTMKALLNHLQQIRQSHGRPATFVQIGANNGKMNDPLYPTIMQNKSAWVGFLVEPQPILYSELVLLHADAPHSWSFYQGVLSDTCENSSGVITFCETKTPGQGNFRTQGQLNGVRNNCKEEDMVLTSRPCLSSYRDLLEHGSQAFHEATRNGNHPYWVDILQIDTEGKDFDLIQMIDPAVLQFTCINFEHTYMDIQHSPRYNQTLTHLETIMGSFEFMKHSAGDTLACRTSSNSAK